MSLASSSCTGGGSNHHNHDPPVSPGPQPLPRSLTMPPTPLPRTVPMPRSPRNSRNSRPNPPPPPSMQSHHHSSPSRIRQHYHHHITAQPPMHLHQYQQSLHQENTDRHDVCTLLLCVFLIACFKCFHKSKKK